MPRGKIVLKNNMGEHHVSGGCLACFGRYENQRDENRLALRNLARNHLTREDVPTLGPKILAGYIDHVTVRVDSITPNLSVLDKESSDWDKMAVVFHELANESVWADAFITKEWADMDPATDEVLMNPHVKAELMISAISVLRRSLQYWYKLQFKYITEGGLNFETALFYAILVTSCGLQDWEGDEQVLPLASFTKPVLSAFLKSELRPEDSESGHTYAEHLGYEQVILTQWSNGEDKDGVHLFKTADEAWFRGLGSNVIPLDILKISDEGRRLTGDSARFTALVKGETTCKQSFPADHGFAKLLGIAGKTIESELVKGKFGNQVKFNIEDLIDVNEGFKFLQEEVLNNG